MDELSCMLNGALHDAGIGATQNIGCWVRRYAARQRNASAPVAVHGDTPGTSLVARCTLGLALADRSDRVSLKLARNTILERVKAKSSNRERAGFADISSVPVSS